MIDENRWHMDRRVPIAIIMALVLQALAFGVAWGSLENRVTQIEMVQEQRTESLKMVPERLARLEAILERIEDILARQEGG